MTARDLASRFFPRPDPVNYAKRQVVPNLKAGDVALRTAIDLRTRVDAVLFRDLIRLHINRTEAEGLLSLVVANLNLAARRFEEVLAMMEAARSENLIREYDRRLLERQHA